MRGSTRSVFFGLAALLSFASAAQAKDTWTKPFDGIKRLHRVTANPNEVVNAVVVDLTTPGIHFQATSTTQRKRTTSSFAKLIKAQVAVNGDFFSYATYATNGLAAGAGAAWKDTKDNIYDSTLWFDKGNHITLEAPKNLLTFDPKTMEGVVSGHPLVVTGGAVGGFPASSSFCTTRHPRTVVGLSQDKNTLYVAVVDGRTSTSVGMTCKELGTLMKGLGASEALNLDGGGSTTMYVQGAGVVNVPSDGSERTVGNHFAIFAPKSGSVGSLTGVVHELGHPEKPIENANVAVANVGEDVTDAQGAFELQALPGTYTVTAKELGYDTASVKATLAAGQELKLEIELAPSAATDFDGDGLPDAKDNCPKVANPDQANNDGDMFGDLCDPDDDDDGVMDEDDTCPFVPGTGADCPATTSGGGNSATGSGGAGAEVAGGIRSTSEDASCAVGRGEGAHGVAAVVALAAAAGLARRRRTT